MDSYQPRRVNGKKVNMKLDTGAKCNILSKQILDEIGTTDQLKKSNAQERQLTVAT